LNSPAFNDANESMNVDFRRMNIAPPEWIRLYPKAANHLTSALCSVFQVPPSTPADLRDLLSRIQARERR
jgi:hypothetical protein